MDKDYFGKQAGKYKLNRPQYSSLLLDKIIQKLKAIGSKQQIMLDIATGSGQLAIALSSKFNQVYGLDISENQIEQASSRDDKGPNVKFEVFDCSQIKKFSDMKKISNYDLITCGQCLHWFEGDKILSQIKHLLTEQSGLLVVLSYVQLSYSPKSWVGQMLIDILQEFREKIWPYFVHKPEELFGYPSYPFHKYFSSIEKQVVEIPFNLSIEEVVKFMCTFSAVQNYNQKQKKNFNEQIWEALLSKLGEEDKKKLSEPSYFCHVTMNYSLIFAYK